MPKGERGVEHMRVSGDVRAEAVADTLLRRVLDAVQDGVLLVDGAGSVRHANAAAARVLGRSADEPWGGDALAFVHPDDRDRALAGFRRCLRTAGPTGRLRCRVRRADGAERVVEVGADNLLGDADVAAVVVTVRDVTDEVESRRLDARNRALVEHGSDLALLLDEDGSVTYVAPAAAVLLGWRVERLEGASGWDFVHEADLQWMRQFWQQVVSEPGLHGPVELRVRHADGGWTWVEERVTNLLHDPGVRGLVVNLRDISEHRRALDALAASEERYRSMVETASEGILVLDPQGRTVFANGRMAQLLGTSADELRGQRPLDLLSPECAAEVQHDVARRLAGATGQYERRLVRLDGSEVWLLVSASPLRDGHGEVVGALAMATDITDRKRAEDELTRLALHDPLTGLPNRALLMDRIDQGLARAARQGRSIGLLFFDLDQFKLVNDARGHAVGDELLHEVAARLSGAVREGDTVARLGGDEFIVLCEDLASEDEAREVADRVHASLATPVRAGDAEVYVTASIGIATAPPLGRDELLRAADAAMYHAKDRGRARTEVYDDTLQAAAEGRLKVLGELRRALPDGQLRLHYQPVVEVATGRVVGVEALLRWQHPERGLLGPAEFVPIAEDSGLIVELGAWSVREACRNAGRLREMLGRRLTVAVNLSARQLADADVVALVRDALAESGMDPRDLVVEVTESAVMGDPVASMTALGELRALGVALAIDDFGTGYSSLAYLKKFPVDLVKVDRSFVAGLAVDEDDSAIVASVVSLAGSVGVHAVAEGVERVEQLTVLHRLGCRFAQGYLWSEPVPADVLGEVLNRLEERRLAPRAVVVEPALHRVPATHGVPAEVLVKVARMQHEGASLHTIAAALNADGVRTTKGSRWHANSVARLVAELEFPGLQLVLDGRPEPA